jgi:Holliday junction resolvase RusA-like endonuclease
VITNLAFTVPGEPQGKGRAKIVKIGGFSRMATPAKTVAYEGLIALAAKEAMRGGALFDGPCALDIIAFCSVPASWSGKKRAEALTGRVLPTKKPDADNITKAVCDGLNGVVWADDVQAVYQRIRKVYGPVPGLRVTVAKIAQTQSDLLGEAA